MAKEEASGSNGNRILTPMDTSSIGENRRTNCTEALWSMVKTNTFSLEPTEQIPIISKLRLLTLMESRKELRL
ncbi:hypothetical protein D3C87_1079570 [compost metagenome]